MYAIERSQMDTSRGEDSENDHRARCSESQGSPLAPAPFAYALLIQGPCLPRLQLVLIHPEIIEDEDSPNGGVLKITFPAETGIAAAQIPLNPSEETLSEWERYGLCSRTSSLLHRPSCCFKLLNRP